MLISFGGPAGALVGFFIADRISRRRALLSSAVVIVVLAAIFPILEDVRFVVVGGFALVTSIYTLVVIGMYGYIPELFPTSLRLRGTGLSGALGRAASIATPYFIVTLFTAYGISGVLTLLVGFLVALSSVILVLRVETGRGSLDDLSPTEGRAT
jgi:putative MFS transporter